MDWRNSRRQALGEAQTDADSSLWSQSPLGRNGYQTRNAPVRIRNRSALFRETKNSQLFRFFLGLVRRFLTALTLLDLNCWQRLEFQHSGIHGGDDLGGDIRSGIRSQQVLL